MGLLKDRKYWGRVLTRTEAFRPLPGQVMSRKNAVSIVHEACRAFSDLVQDVDFEVDVEEAIRTGQQALRNMPRDDDAFQEYIKQFREIEREVLLQSGVSERATIEIERELSELVRLSNERDFERVQDKIQQMRKICCQHATDPAYLDEPPREFSADVLDAVKGVGIVGVDIGSMHHWGIISDAIIGTSVSAGLAKFRPLLRRIW